MGIDVEFSDDAAVDRAKLPLALWDGLDRTLHDLAENPPATGRREDESIEWVSDDGTHYYVSYSYERRGDVLVVLTVEIMGY